jgi:TP901 family phage tail tape measure protein
VAVRRLDLIITSNSTAAVRGFFNLAGAANAAERRMGKVGAVMTRVLGGAAVVAGAFAVKSVQAFIAFDEAMTESIAIMDDISGPTRKKMEEAAKAVARTTTFSATEAAEAFYGLASAGLNVKQSIEALPVIATFAQAGLMDMSVATDFLVNAQAALGLKMKDPIKNMIEMQRVADVLTETNNLATGTVEEFAEALTSKAGGALKAVNKDIEEGAAVLAFMAEQGIRGSRAGQALAVVLRDVPRAAQRNVEVFREFGISVFDSSGNLKNLADVVAEFEQALGPMTDAQKAAAFEQLGLTRNVGDTLRQLLGGSQTIRDFEAALRNAGGATQEVADKQLESLKAKLQIVKNRFNNLMIDFGEPIAIWLVDTFIPWVDTVAIPALKEMGAVLNDDLRPAFEAMGTALDNPRVVQGLTALIAFAAGMKVASGVIKFFAVVLAPVAKIIGFLSHPIKTVGLAFLQLRIWMLPLVGIFKLIAGTIIGPIAAAFQLIMFLLLGPIGLFIRFGAVVFLLRGQIVKAFVAIKDAIVGAVRAVIDWFSGTFIPFWQGIWRGLQTPIDILLAFLQRAWQLMMLALIGRFIVIAGFIVGFWDEIKAVFMAAVKVVVFLVTKAWGILQTVTSFAWGIISEVISFVWDKIRTTISVTANVIKVVVLAVWDAIKAATSAVWNAISTVIGIIWRNVIKPIFDAISYVVRVFLIPTMREFGRVIGVVWDAVKTAINKAWVFVRDRVFSPINTFVREKLVPAFTFLRDKLADVWSSVRSAASRAWERIVSAIKRPVNAIIGFINRLIGGINTVLDKIPGMGNINIPKIPTIGESSGGTAANSTRGANALAGAESGARLGQRGPFRTSGPEVVVGEGRRQYPEYVVPTDPHHRGRATSLFGMLAKDLGLPGLGIGGILGGLGDAFSGGVNWIKNRAGDIGSFLQRTALTAFFGPINALVKSLLAKIEPGPFHLVSGAQGVREALWNWVRGVDSGLPEAPPESAGGGGGSARGLVGFAATAFRIFRQMFPGMTIGGWRARGSVPGSDHPKGKALDLMTRNGATASRIINTFMGQAGRKYWIWSRQIADARSGWVPRYYGGPSPHTDHVHLSYFHKGGRLPEDITGIGHRSGKFYGMQAGEDIVPSGKSRGNTINIENMNVMSNDPQEAARATADELGWIVRTMA